MTKLRCVEDIGSRVSFWPDIAAGCSCASKGQYISINIYVCVVETLVL